MSPSPSPSFLPAVSSSQNDLFNDADSKVQLPFSMKRNGAGGGNAAPRPSTSSPSPSVPTIPLAGTALIRSASLARIVGKRRYSPTSSPQPSRNQVKSTGSTGKARRTTITTTGIPAHGVARGMPPATGWTGPTPPPATTVAGNLNSYNMITTIDHDGADQRPADGTPTRREASRPWDPGGNPHNISK